MLGFEIEGKDAEGKDRTVYAECGNDSTWLCRVRIGYDRTFEPEVDDVNIVVKVMQSALEAIRENQHRFVLYLEDTILVSGTSNSPVWPITALDVMTGETRKDVWSFERVLAVCTLAIGGDEHPDSAALYPVAETAVDGWPHNLRPIP